MLSSADAQVKCDPFPASLRESPRWVCWKYVFKANRSKPAKVPIDSYTGGFAAVNDPSTWRPFDEAFEFYQGSDSDGLAVVLNGEAEENGYVLGVVDLDDCITPTGELIPEAADVVERLDSFTELSHSKRGIHIFFYADAGWEPPWNRKAGFEFYSKDRLVATTERPVGDPRPIAHRQQEVESLMAEIESREPKRRSGGTPRDQRNSVPPDSSLSEDEVLRLARGSRKDGEAFSALYDRGDCSKFHNAKGEPDESSRDHALLNHLYYWTGGDREQVRRLFESSACFRPGVKSSKYVDYSFDQFVAEGKAVYRGRSGASTASTGVGGATASPPPGSTSGSTGASASATGGAAPPPGSPPGGKSRPKRPKPTFWTNTQIDSAPPPQWLVSNHFEVGSLAVVFGGSGSSKSQFALSVTWAMACGMAEVFGSPGEPGFSVRPAKILYWMSEGGPSGYKRRRDAWESFHGVRIPDDSFLVAFHSFDFSQPSSGDDFADLVEAQNFEPDMLVVDTLSRNQGAADQDGSVGMIQFFNQVVRVQERFGCAALVVHHSGHDQTRERGSTVIRDYADHTIKLSRKGERLAVEFVKHRDSETGGVYHLRSEKVLASRVLVPANGGSHSPSAPGPQGESANEFQPPPGPKGVPSAGIERDVLDAVTDLHAKGVVVIPARIDEWLRDKGRRTKRVHSNLMTKTLASLRDKRLIRSVERVVNSGCVTTSGRVWEPGDEWENWSGEGATDGTE